jgi:3,4-dihydroxy 2-butanone 4-phosphate synthase
MMDGETGQATSVADARKYAEENGLVLLRGEDIINEYLKE